MKNRSTLIIMIICLVLVCASTTLSAVGYIRSLDDEPQNDGQTQTKTDAETPETIVNNNTIYIEGAEGNTAYAAAAGLRSTVSVYCTFETTVGGTSFWNPTPTTQTYYSAGSGVIYKTEEDGSAFVITNFHVVYDGSSNTANRISNKIYLYLYGLESEQYAIPATYVGGSASYDIAVLRVEQSEVLAGAIASGAAVGVEIGDSDLVAPGQSTVVIGNPSATGLGGLSVTQGIVSVDSEYITMSASDGSGDTAFRVIRTDAAVNAGNSGGGMYNDRGELVGIVNAKISSTEIENIGYAIPSNVVRAIADNIIDYCYEKDCESVMRCILGVTVNTASLSSEYDAESGMLVKKEQIAVYEISSGGLCDGVLEEGDVIISVSIGNERIEVTRRHHLTDAMLDARPGDTVEFEIERGGETITVTLTVTEDCLTAY